MVAQFLNNIAKLGAAIGAGGFVVQECLYNVDAGERAVMFSRLGGIRDKTYPEGTHFKVPFLEYPHVMDVRTRPRVISSVTGTKDLQTVNISLRVLFRPQEEHLAQIYRELGPDFEDRVLPSLGNEVLKAIVAQYNADQLLTSREKVSRQISEELTTRAGQFNLLLDDVSITHLTYGAEFTHAVEAKQVAFQDAERSKFVVMKAEQEKKAAIIKAEGEAEAAKLISEAIASSGSGFIAVQRIDAAKEIAETLARSRSITYLPNSDKSGLLLGLNSQ